jgi:hypothetical protein
VRTRNKSGHFSGVKDTDCIDHWSETGYAMYLSEIFFAFWNLPYPLVNFSTDNGIAASFTFFFKNYFAIF